MDEKKIHIGTCGWKYESWQGLVYSKRKPGNFLVEYSRHFGTVEVDQWFWSLFAGDKAVLPKASVVKEYAESVPDDFTFSIKVPNSITLTHHYKKRKSDDLQPNPHFLSADLMEKFLDSISPLSGKIGPLIFQFEYLNKQKMRNMAEFIERFGEFTGTLPDGFQYCVETRNPNYLNKKYFEFLFELHLCHVFLQGYYMPSIFEVYRKFSKFIKDLTVIRLHGPDRKKMEEQTGEDWSRIIAPKDDDITMLADMLAELDSHKVETFLYVNNHFEGSAPRSIQKIREAVKI